MKAKRYRKIIIVFVSIFLILLGMEIRRLSMSNLPHGEFILESMSPNGTHTINAYLIYPALSSPSVRCEVIGNGTNKTRNIYWQYLEGWADILWETDEVVFINGIRLDVRKDKYNSRRYWNTTRLMEGELIK